MWNVAFLRVGGREEDDYDTYVFISALGVRKLINV